MSLTVMNFNRIRDLVSNLGSTGEENSYIMNFDCLKHLEELENELLKEDVLNRNVRISLHICATVKKDLVPILIHGKDSKVLAIVIRVLANLSMPVEYLLPNEDATPSPKHLNVRKKLLLSTFAIKKAFLDAPATLSLVTMLRDTMLKSEKHDIPLKEEDCIHLNNCLILLRNLLQSPEDFGKIDENCIPKPADWSSVHNKLIWNIFVQGIDGALILMLNSQYRGYWTVPLALIIGLIFRNQNIHKVHTSIEIVSSASESSGEDVESDTSKYSSISLSSEPSKISELLSDSGCPPSCESSEMTCDENENSVKECFNDDDDTNSPLNIQKKLEQVQISDDSECQNLSKNKGNSKQSHKNRENVSSHQYADDDSESSSSSESPHHKKIKGDSPSHNNSCKSSNCVSKCDSAMSEGMDYNSPDSKSSDDDNFNEKRVVENLKAVQKLKSEQLRSKFSESDSSNENVHRLKKHRNHPPTGRRGKSPRRKDGCVPSICIDSAYSLSYLKGKKIYPLWKKRNSVSTLTNNNSPSPSDDDIGFLLKEFTLTFLHSGFSDLILNLKNMVLTCPCVGIDKSLLYWMLRYFLHLAASVNLSINHVSKILNPDMIAFLIYESVSACEILMNSKSSENVQRYVSVHLSLLATALREVISTIDLYFKKSSLQKDKSSFINFYGKLSESLDFRQVPLLLLHLFPKINSRQYLEDVIVLNHHIIIAIERGSSYAWEYRKVNMSAHLKQFSSKDIVDFYRTILENYKLNSSFLNGCIFTMWHHLAGDINSSHLLFHPAVLKVFSDILKEDIEIDQYQEDLIIYILSKFRQQVQKRHYKEKQSKLTDNHIRDDTSSNSSLSSHCLLDEDDDDLYWWYLQFQQDKDPISRISEHIPTAKRDILIKLHLKGIISSENLLALEKRMVNPSDSDDINETIKQVDNLNANFDEDITFLLRSLVQAGERQHLIWLQNVLLETCYVKLDLNTYAAEPVLFFSLKLLLSVPLVPYTADQREILKDKTFITLLQKLGLDIGLEDGQMYPRIPLTWTTDMIFAIAARLGPIKREKLKFSYEDLALFDTDVNHIQIKPMECPDLPPLSSHNTLSSWLTAVQQSKKSYKPSEEK